MTEKTNNIIDNISSKVPRWIAISLLCILMMLLNFNTSLAFFSVNMFVVILLFSVIWGGVLHIFTMDKTNGYIVGIGAFVTSIIFLLILMGVDQFVNILGDIGRDKIPDLWISHFNIFSLAINFVLYKYVWLGIYGEIK